MEIQPRFAVIVALAISLSVESIAEGQNGATTLARGADPRNVVMNAQAGPVGMHLVNNDRLVACQYAPGRTPAQGSARSTAIILFDLKSGREISRTPFADWFPVNFTTCSPDGRYLIVGGRTTTHQIDLEKGVIARTWTPKQPFELPAVSPDSKVLALCDDRLISLYDLDSGKLIRRLPPHPSQISTIAFDQAGSAILSSCSELTRRWDLVANKRTSLNVHNRFRSLVIDPEGARLYGTHMAHDVTGGTSCYDLRSGRQVMHVKDHFSMAIDFSSNQCYSINMSRDSAIDAIEVRSLSSPNTPKYLPFDPRLRQLSSRSGSNSSAKVSLSPDKKYLLTTLRNGEFCQVWKLDDLTQKSMVSSASQFQHKHVPVQASVENKTREQLFLDEIYGITDKVRKLKEAGKTDAAEKEIEALFAAGNRRLQRAPRRHQLLIEQCGLAYSDVLRDHDKGYPFYTKALEMAESGNRLDRNWEGILRAIGSIHEYRGEKQQASKMYRRIVDHREANGLPVDDTDFRTLAWLATDFQNPGNSPEALPLYYQTWLSSKLKYGLLSENTRAAYDSLVEHASKCGGWATLEPVLVEQLKEYQRHKGPGHPDTANAAQQLAELYERLDKPDQALDTMDLSQRLLRDHVARVLPSLSEAEQRVFLNRKFQPALDAAFELAIRLKNHPKAAELSAGWILNAKGAATRALAERARIAASTKDPEVRSIAAELAETREELSSLSLTVLASADPHATDSTDETGTSSAVNERASQLETLRQRESELSWKLGLAGWTELRQEPWTSVSAVRERIPSEAILLELTITGLSEEDPREDGPDYGRESKIAPQNEVPKVVMWIIPPAGKGKVRMAVLCEDLMQLVRPLASFHACVSGQVAGSEAVELGRACLSAIAQQLVRPLPADVIKAEQWLVSPDHLLWMIPWAALPESPDRLVVQRHEVQYLLSGRDLLTLPASESQSAPMIVANPNYGTAGSGSNGSAAFTPLPGTAKEAAGVLPYLQRLGGVEPDLFVGAKAQESVVKAAQRPKVALFSTHGFASVVPGQHPMATCGLAFCGANTAIRGSGDGVLTGLEILASDYRGTELVVLSACQTALGSINSGEGVASLRYAFQLAGAKNVAATLWSIPDEVTAVMMKDFFKHYSSGKSASAALRLAQLATIHRLESVGQEANPALWAAFTIAGPPSQESSADLLTQEWRSANGRFTVVATLVGCNSKNVVLRKQDGAEIEVPLSQLHPTDRDTAIKSIE